MQSTYIPEVKVIYAGSSRARAYSSVGTSSTGGVGFVILLNLLVAAGWSYGTWWHGEPELAAQVTTYTVAFDEAATMERMARIFGVLPAKTAGKPETKSAPNTEKTEPYYTGQTARTVIRATAIGWATLMTLVSCALALSVGAAFGARRGSLGKRVALLTLLVSCATAALVIVFILVPKHGSDQLITIVRWGGVGVACMFLLLGVSIGKGARGLSRTASVVIILSAVGSVAALCLFEQSGVTWPAGTAVARLASLLRVETTSTALLATVFIVQSLYGWLLLPLSSRIRE